MPIYKIPLAGYSVKFSPFYEHRAAVATAPAEKFGLVGNGGLHIFDFSPPSSPSSVTEHAFFKTAHGVLDISWSEFHDSLLVAAMADGSLKLYALSLPPQANPLRTFHEHTSTVQSSDWNPTRGDWFLSASWDHTVKLWTPERHTSLRTFTGHADLVESVAWNSRQGDIFASSSNRTVKIWDMRVPSATMIMPASHCSILCCEWNKHDDCIFVSSGDDNTIKVWDVRNYFRVPIAVLKGHGCPVGRVKCSPYRKNLIMSCSYDMTVSTWDYTMENLIRSYNHHTDFAMGIDMSDLVYGLVASTGWDNMVYVWPHGTWPC